MRSVKQNGWARASSVLARKFARNEEREPADPPSDVPGLLQVLLRPADPRHLRLYLHPCSGPCRVVIHSPVARMDVLSHGDVLFLRLVCSSIGPKMTSPMRLMLGTLMLNWSLITIRRWRRGQNLPQAVDSVNPVLTQNCASHPIFIMLPLQTIWTPTSLLTLLLLSLSLDGFLAHTRHRPYTMFVIHFCMVYRRLILAKVRGCAYPIHQDKGLMSWAH